MEALILRRNYPRPVTFADLRRAFTIAVDAYCDGPEVRPRIVWHAALKSATGATDDVYAVVDGREVRVGRIDCCDEKMWNAWCAPMRMMDARLIDGVTSLLIKADEQAYWERPHEVRLDLRARDAVDAASTLGA